MRDTSEGMIEFIDAINEGDGYFSIINVPKNNEKEQFRFGVSLKGYKALIKILQSRPLGTMPGLQCRYFWGGSMGGKTESNIFISIRVEIEGGNSKNIDYEVPQELASNIKWFSELGSFDEAAHLKNKT